MNVNVPRPASAALRMNRLFGDTLSHGTGVSGDFVSGNILVFGDSQDSAITTNAAIIYDAACPGGCTGNDDDLFQPTEGKVLIIAEDLVLKGVRPFV